MTKSMPSKLAFCQATANGKKITQENLNSLLCTNTQQTYWWTCLCLVISFVLLQQTSAKSCQLAE